MRAFPQLAESLAQWIPQIVKVENFLCILHSSCSRWVQRHQCYTICWGRGCCKTATVAHLPIRPLRFTEVLPQGAKVEIFLYILRSSGPHRVQRRQCYTTCWGRSCCKMSTAPYLQFAPYISQGANISNLH